MTSYTNFLLRAHVFSFAVAGFVPTAAQAQQKPPADSARTTRVLPSVQVTAAPIATDVRQTAQPIDVLAGAALRRSNAASLGETLEQLPGVRSLSMTTGIGKPVIRGLTNNRVVTLANGQRTETQQWGHDHSPNVESADADRIEVVKGPASVLYGSDALGGVVNVIRKALPHGPSGDVMTRGRVALAYHSAMNAPSATLVGEGAVGAFGWRASGTSRRADDLRTPTGIVPNTGNRTGYGELALGWRRNETVASLTSSTRNERIRVADSPITAPGYTGHQQIRTERVTLDATSTVKGQRLQLLGGWEQNRRAEYASTTARDVTLGLRSTTANGFLNWRHAPVRGVSGALGINVQHTAFRTFGTQTLIPDNSASAIGVYAYEQREVGTLAFSAGARHDWRTLETPGNAVLRLATTRRAFQATTGTVGAVWRSREPIAVAFNVARGFRAPSASDLFANGFHEGTRAFEIGRADLRVESSLNTDLGLRVRHARGSGELTGYVNRIRDYIYLAPVGAPGRALDSLEVLQGDARLMGVEVAATVPLRSTARSSLQLQVSGDVVNARNTVDGSALPFVPPMRGVSTLRWDERAPGRYLAVTGEWNARQSRVFRRDFAPPAWQLYSASAGSSFLTPRGLVFVDVTVKNLLDARYRDFMSRYKEFADAAGRAVVLRVSADF